MTAPIPSQVAATPKRIQRQRTKGWRMPEGAVYVGRPSRWGNPFVVHRVDCSSSLGMCWSVATHTSTTDIVYAEHLDTPRRAAQEAVDLFALHIGPMGSYEYSDEDLALLRAKLGGRDLACWCPVHLPCHADVLLSLANPARSAAAVAEGAQ